MMIKTTTIVKEEEERMMMVVSMRKEEKIMMTMKVRAMMTPMMMALGWLVMINLLILTQGMTLTCRGAQSTYQNQPHPTQSARLS